jgi:DNA topoisomerase-2
MTVGNYIRKGKDTIRIRELPVGAKNCKSFTGYKEFLNLIVDENTQRNKAAKKEAAERDDDDDEKDDISVLVDLIDSYEVVKETDTDFVVDLKFKPGKLDQEIAANTDFKFEKQLKLAFTFATTNIHAYDAQGLIHKYETPESIIDAFSAVRLDFYARRKTQLLSDYAVKHGKASARYRFVTAIMDGTLDIYRKSRTVVESMLQAADYPRYSGSACVGEEDQETQGGFKYLLSMQISSFTEETLVQLKKEIDELQAKIDGLTSKTIDALWLEELDVVQKEYRKSVDNWLTDNTITIYASS